METVSPDRETITITLNGAGKVVLLAIEEYEEYEEMQTTLYLFSTRAMLLKFSKALSIMNRSRFYQESYATDVAAERMERLLVLKGA